MRFGTPKLAKGMAQYLTTPPTATVFEEEQRSARLQSPRAMEAPARNRPDESRSPRRCERLPEDWRSVLGPQTLLELAEVLRRLAEERALLPDLVYPPLGEVFRAFERTPFAEVRVVVLGQDPYHGEGQANGLAFSVAPGVPAPPSLVNILREAGAWPAPHGDLSSWADQGVLLLNASLTVRAGRAGSHSALGWRKVTDGMIRTLSRCREGLVFLFWGRHAEEKRALIEETRHHVLLAPHPSPLSCARGFTGCGHFTQTNALLAEQGAAPIRWSLQPTTSEPTEGK